MNMHTETQTYRPTDRSEMSADPIEGIYPANTSWRRQVWVRLNIKVHLRFIREFGTFVCAHLASAKRRLLAVARRLCWRRAGKNKNMRSRDSRFVTRHNCNEKLLNYGKIIYCKFIHSGYLLFIKPLQVLYYSEALQTQHRYCARVSRRSATGNCE